MGAKTSMLVFSDKNVPDILKRHPFLNREATDHLVHSLFHSERLSPSSDVNLSYTYPTENEIYAGCFWGLTILIAREFAIGCPSRLDNRFIEGSTGQYIHLHAMHSAVDWMAFAKWEQGRLLRSLSLSPDRGIMEDVGEKLRFETPYWAGELPATAMDEEDDYLEEYPLQFHPLDLGEDALQDFFGFQIEGISGEYLFNHGDITLARYQRV